MRIIKSVKLTKDNWNEFAPLPCISSIKKYQNGTFRVSLYVSKYERASIKEGESLCVRAKEGDTLVEYDNEKWSIKERSAKLIGDELCSLWVLTSDRLPETGKNVLVVTVDGWIKEGYWDGEQWWWADGFPIGMKDNGDVDYSSYCVMQGVVTWMPIPKLPDCVKPHYYGIDSDIE